MTDLLARKGAIGVFASHRVAANILMALMLLFGWLGLKNLNTQLFPTFTFDYITVRILWVGASPEDVEKAITIPVEQALRTTPNMRKLIARSQQGASIFFLEMLDGTDVGLSLDDVKQRIAGIRNLPDDAEAPMVVTLERFSPIANIIVYTERGTLDELRPLVRQMENELLGRGLGRVDFAGLPDEEMAIQVPASHLHKLGMSLNQLAGRIRQFSRDIPSGTLGRDEAARQVRALGQRRDEQAFADMVLFSDENGRMLHLGDIAHIERRARENQGTLSFRGHPAIELQILRTEAEDTLRAARILEEWVADVQTRLPQGVHLHRYQEVWKHLRDRISMLVSNGFTGLILVVMTLFFFLNARVAFWVMVGIPVSFMATLGVLSAMGGTINMVSLFGLILALGIIVDDAIVVGEDTLTHLQQGDGPLDAAIGGARRMFWPVIASSLTTIAAFAPLALMGGPMGKIAFDIPFVMICVILASLVECFLILPGHLHHAFRDRLFRTHRIRQRIDDGFAHFREVRFRPWVAWAIKHRYSTVAAAVCAFVIALTIVMTGWLKFTFFPPIDSEQIRAVVEFNAGTDKQQIESFMVHLQDTLSQTDRDLERPLVTTVLQHHGVAADFPNIGGLPQKFGDQYGTLVVEVYTGSDRQVSNDEFIRSWRKRIVVPPGLEQLSIAQREEGPPGKPLEIRLSGASAPTLKKASLEVQKALAAFTGISNVDDDLPWGKEQLTFELTDAARARGLTLVEVAAQMRAGFDGALAQLFNDADEEIEVRVMLPDSERNHLADLDRLPIMTPDGETLLLADVVVLDSLQGFDLLRRVDSRLSVIVSADLDPNRGNANEIMMALREDVLPDIMARYRVAVDYEGRLADQAENMRDIQTGIIVGLSLIYLVLAWVFSAWSWPVAIMTAIMFGFTGAVLGHLIMGLFGVKFSMFSIMGLFGLSGIIVNDSIVLINFYQQLIHEEMDRFEAIVEACVRRLRAVLLTSITTVAGLTPMLFESSLQAQFLKPMAVSIVFGLALGTVLILAVVPSMLMIIEDLRQRLGQGRASSEQAA